MIFSQEGVSMLQSSKVTKDGRIEHISFSDEQERNAIDAGIKLYVEHELASGGEENEDSILASEPNLALELQRQLISKAGGMYTSPFPQLRPLLIT